MPQLLGGFKKLNMKTGLVITTINKLNKNLKNIDLQTNLNDWDFCIIGDKKLQKNSNFDMENI